MWISSHNGRTKDLKPVLGIELCSISTSRLCVTNSFMKILIIISKVTRIYTCCEHCLIILDLIILETYKVDYIHKVRMIVVN